MVLNYVLKSFRRRKVRTTLMVLSLIFSTSLIVAMSALVETMRRSNTALVASVTGMYDLTITRAEISPEPFMFVDETTQRILAADDKISAVYPRFFSDVELTSTQQQTTGKLLAIDPTEGIGQIEVLSGSFTLGERQAAILESTAIEMGDLQVGDTLDVAFSYPQPREEGSVGSVDSSQRRMVVPFTISSIVQARGGVAPGFDSGIIVHIEDAQTFLRLPGQAGQLVVLVDPALYEAPNAEAVALGVRDVAVQVQTELGVQHVVRAAKADALDELAQAFMIAQALVNTYGLMSLGVVGLLVYTLVMTNVQEQRREMAILRILGSQRQVLFSIVIVEVIVIGLVGVSLGSVLGQLITTYAVVPLIENMVRAEGTFITLEPVVTFAGILPAILSASVVLLLSAIRPAQDAAKTKVIHAINPGVADNIQLEDLDKLRERRPSRKLFFLSLAILSVVVMLFGLILVLVFGDPVALAAIFMIILILLVVGVVFGFFVFTRPIETLVLMATNVIAPRLTYFAKRNVGRSTERNTLISLLIVLSGVLPSFLATNAAMEYANIQTNVQLDMGAPLSLGTYNPYESPEFAVLTRLQPSFISDELLTVPGIEKAVGLTYSYRTPVYDAVEMRSGSLSLVGVTGDLNDVLYEDLVVFSSGGADAFTQIQNDPSAVIISQGMADGLAVPLNGTIMVQGEGLDHRETLTVVGIAQRLPGFGGIGRIRNQSLADGTVLISLAGFQRVTTSPRETLPDADSPTLNRVLATVSSESDTHALEADLRETMGEKVSFWLQIHELEIEQAQADFQGGQIMLLVLTQISFVTAVFGVFAVIFVNIYARRQEIGMLKAVGMRNRELNGMLSVEAITMSLSAALTGILAGSTMAYAFAYINNSMAQRPQQFTLDTTVMPVIILLVSVASLLGTLFSARRIIKHKAIEILRMS